jgi:hypothetical protein
VGDRTVTAPVQVRRFVLSIYFPRRFLTPSDPSATL